MGKIVVNARFLTQKLTGVQRFALEITCRLKKEMGDDLVVVTPHNVIQNKYAQELDAKCIGFNSGHAWEQYDLPLYLYKERSPLLICLCNTAPIYYTNKIVTIHDIAFEVFPKTFSKSFLYFYKFLIPRVAKSSKHIVTVSEFSKHEICSIYNIDYNKVSVIPNAVNEDFYHIPDKSIRNCNYFLAVSSLNHRKNFISVLKAFKKMTSQHNNYNLFVVGDILSKSFSKVDLSEYATCSSIKFLGRVSDTDLIKYYSNAIGFVYPSLYEGFGIPPLEAQKCECPVLCSDIPVLREVCNDSVLYCDPYNANDIAEKMMMITQMGDTLKEKGKANVSRFSWSKSTGRFVKILESQ